MNVASQRQNGFNSGVHDGESASSVDSTGLEKITRGALEALRSKFVAGVTWRKGIAGDELKTMLGSRLAANIAGMSPDGGMFFKNGQLLMVIECKKQGPKGNAIERWFKNWLMADALSCKRYVTLCMRDGFYGGSAEGILGAAMAVVEPSAEDMWSQTSGRLGFYRFTDLDDAEKRIPSILTRELTRIGVIQ